MTNDNEKREDQECKHESDETLKGIVAELGSLPEYTVLSENALARMFHRHKVSIKRAVERGELPPGVKMFGEQAWTVKVIREHITQRLEKAAKDTEKLNQRISKLSA
jgi:hypothetical protein